MIASEISRAVATCPDAGSLFESIVKNLTKIVPFDHAIFSICIPDKSFSRPVFHEPQIENHIAARWAAMPTYWKEWIRGSEPWINDITEYLKLNFGVKKIWSDIILKQIIADGFKSCLCFPLLQGDVLVGDLTLFSFARNRYQKEHFKLLHDVGIDYAMLSVIKAMRQSEAEFIFELIKSVAKSTDHKELAQKLVDAISNHFKFQHVSILKVNALRGRFELLAQATNSADGFKIDSEYFQDLNEGIAGLTYRTATPQIVENTSKKSRKAKLYISANVETRSELCIPISLRGRILWVLNLEDHQINAFHKAAELVIISKIIDEIEPTISRMFDGLVLDDVIQALPDAVLIASVDGKVLNRNEKFRDIFEGQESDRGTDINTLSSELFKLATAKHQIANSQMMTLRSRSGLETSTLVSTYFLSEMYDHTVIILKDAADIQWEGDRLTLNAAIGEAAAQCRVPLSFATNILRQIAKTTDGQTRIPEAAEKAIKHLEKVEFTYDRIFRFFGDDRNAQEPPVKLILHNLLSIALSELPHMSREFVRLQNNMPDNLMILASAYDLLFVIKSILAYFLRYISRDHPLRVNLVVIQNRAKLSFEGLGAQVAPSSSQLEAAIKKVKARVSLGAETLEEITHRQGGGFRWTTSKSGTEEVTITIPVV